MTEESKVLGKWHTGSIPELPSAYETANESIATVFEYTTQMLEVAVAALKVARAFSTANIDPLEALANEVIEQVEGYLKSLSQIGLYIHGDWPRLQATSIEQLQGGFAAYERRMVTRLVDTSDPDRPDIANTQQTVAVFFYGSVPYSNVELAFSLVRYVKTIMDWFGAKTEPPKILPTATSLEVAYGPDEAVAGEFGPLWEAYGVKSKAPTRVELSWALTLPKFKGGQNSATMVVPDGFLIEVSTIKKGLEVCYDRPRPNAGVVAPSQGDKSEKVQPREHGPVLDPYGKPMVLFGGSDQVDVNSWNAALDDAGRIKPGYARVVGYSSVADGETYPLDMLKTTDGTYYLQRTFYVKAGGRMATNGKTRAVIEYSDLPYPVKVTISDTTHRVTFEKLPRPEVYYWRVVPVLDPIKTSSSLKYRMKDELKFGSPPRASFVSKAGKSDIPVRGVPSVVSEFEHATPDEADYYSLVMSALAVMVLSRSDLSLKVNKSEDEGKVGEPKDGFWLGRVLNYTGLETIAKSLMPTVLGMAPTEYFNTVGPIPEVFRANLLKKITEFAAKSSKYGKVSFQRRKALLKSAKVLLTWKWSDNAEIGDANYNKKRGFEFFPELTILGSLWVTDHAFGVAQNAYSILDDDIWMPKLQGASKVWGSRAPSFYTKANKKGQIVQGSGDLSPVIYGSNATISEVGVETDRLNIPSARVLFCRNVIPDEVYQAAIQVLQQITAPGDVDNSGRWIALRPLGWAPDLSEQLETVVAAMRASVAIAKSKAEALDRAINILEAKVLQLMQTLQRIRGLLERTVSLQLQTGSVLLVVADGTDGILGGLTTAQDKPSDGPLDFSAGVVVVAGTGVPVDLVSEFFTPTSE